MVTTPSQLRSRYDIVSTVNPLFSFYQTIVPKEHSSLIRFINSIILNFPYLSGLAARYAAALASKVDYSKMRTDLGDKGFTDVVMKNLEDTINNCGYHAMQLEVFTNLFFYPRIAVTITKKYDYLVKCHHCGKDINIAKLTGKFFEVQLTTATSGNDIKIKAVFKCPICGKGNTGVTLRWKKRVGTITDPGFFFNMWNPYYFRVSRGMMRRKSLFVVDMDRFRECYPDRYCNGSYFTFADLDGVEPEFLKAMLAYREYTPNVDMTHLFVNEPLYAGLEAELSPALLNVAALMHNGVLRRGQEADAIIKASPNILITPEMGENSKASTTLDGRLVNDIVMQLVKEVQSGDTLGLGYIPVPMKATSLFAEPRRTTLEREIREEEMNVLMTTGIDSSIFQGGTGMSENPFVLTVMQELFSRYSSQMDDASESLITMIKTNVETVKLPNELRKLTQTRIDEQPGTYIDKEYADYAAKGLVPVGPIIRSKYHFASAEAAIKERMEEERNIAAIKRDYERKISADAQTDEIRDAAAGQVSEEMISKVEMQLTEQAEQIALEMEQMDEGQKRSELDRLSKNNRLLRAMVGTKLEELNNIRTQEAKSAVQQGGAE